MSNDNREQTPSRQRQRPIAGLFAVGVAVALLCFTAGRSYLALRSNNSEEPGTPQAMGGGGAYVPPSRSNQRLDPDIVAANKQRIQHLKAAQARTLSNAKQIAVALQDYARHNGNTLPAADKASDIQARLGRYVEDSSVFFPASAFYGSSGLAFHYTFSGGKIKPRDTAAAAASVKGTEARREIGYVLGPGGRAVIYADGLAKWEDGLPPQRAKTD